MTTVSKVIDVLTRFTSEPEATIRQKLRRLQDDQILPVASGRAVPDITPLHLAAAITGVFASEKVKDASKAWNRCRDLRTANPLPRLAPNRAKEIYDAAVPTFAEWFVDVIEAARDLKSAKDDFNPLHSNSVYEFVLSWPEITVRVDRFIPEAEDGTGGFEVQEDIRFAEPNHFSHWRGQTKKSHSLNGICLAQIVWGIFGHPGDAA